MQENTIEPLVYTVKELSKILKISLSMTYRLTKADNFPIIRIGGKRILIPEKELKIWLSKNCNGIQTKRI